jgi:hypothetical protein
MPDAAKPESRVKRLTRWLKNDRIEEGVYFLPYADIRLSHLALETVVLVMDGSGVGDGCSALMMHVLSKGRALPLAWRVRGCPKGHCPQALHIEVVEVIRDLIPEGTQVVFLGDGEFDGVGLQKTLTDAGGLYAGRTSTSTTATWQGETFALEELGWSLKAGRLIELQDVAFPQEAYGPVMVRSCWGQGEAEPLYLVSKMERAEEALSYDQKRFRIETFFSDPTSRGFNIHQSHLSDPQRLSRLRIATCLAYIWVVYLGS